jgi:F-type H+-transporting ATPase subunit delta
VSVDAAAERYSQAIFEIGSESGQLERMSQEIEDFANSFAENQMLRRALENPALDEGQREAVLLQMARQSQLSPLTINSLRVLAKRRRLGALPQIARRLRSLADEKNGVLRAKITSAGSLSETYFNELKQNLERAFGKRVIVEHEEDPELIGGIVTRIGDNIFDGSIAGRLDELERRLLASG